MIMICKQLQQKPPLGPSHPEDKTAKIPEKCPLCGAPTVVDYISLSPLKIAVWCGSDKNSINEDENCQWGFEIE